MCKIKEVREWVGTGSKSLFLSFHQALTWKASLLTRRKASNCFTLIDSSDLELKCPSFPPHFLSQEILVLQRKMCSDMSPYLTLGASLMAQLVKNLSAMQETSVQSGVWVGKIPWWREWQPTPVLLPGGSHGKRSLAGYSPWSRKESDMTKRHTPNTNKQLRTFPLPFDFSICGNSVLFSVIWCVSTSQRVIVCHFSVTTQIGEYLGTKQYNGLLVTNFIALGQSSSQCASLI